MWGRQIGVLKETDTGSQTLTLHKTELRAKSTKAMMFHTMFPI